MGSSNWRDEDKMEMTKRDRERFYARQRLEDMLVRASERILVAERHLSTVTSEIHLAKDLIRKVLRRFDKRREL